MSITMILFQDHCLLFNEHQWNRNTATAFWYYFFNESLCYCIVRHSNYKNQRALMLDVVNYLINYIYSKLNSLIVNACLLHTFFQFSDAVRVNRSMK